MQEYVRAYAEHFNLHPHIRLMCRVLRLRQRPPTAPPGPGQATCGGSSGSSSGGWRCEYQDLCTNQVYALDVDYVVLCTGLFHEPYIPDLPVGFPGGVDYGTEGGGLFRQLVGQLVGWLVALHRTLPQALRTGPAGGPTGGVRK